MKFEKKTVRPRKFQEKNQLTGFAQLPIFGQIQETIFYSMKLKEDLELPNGIDEFDRQTVAILVI